MRTLRGFNAASKANRDAKERREKVEQAIESVLEKKDAVAVFGQGDRKLEMLFCAIEDLRKAYKA